MIEKKYNIFRCLECCEKVKIDYDLEQHPLQIKTDTEIGSHAMMVVELLEADDSYISNFRVKFSDPPTYYLSYYTFPYTFFPISLPTEQDKTWTISKTPTRLEIWCNGVEVLEYVFSESGESDCVGRMSRDVENIYFPSWDTASWQYR